MGRKSGRHSQVIVFAGIILIASALVVVGLYYPAGSFVQPTYQGSPSSPGSQLTSFSTEETNFVQGPGGTVLSFSGGQGKFYHKDRIGSVKATTDSSGNSNFQSDYYPFGTGFSQRGEQELGFIGKEEDRTGLDYLGARYYDPEQGRFTQVDPVRGEESPYIYSRNNPLTFVDLNGKEPAHHRFVNTDPRFQPAIDKFEDVFSQLPDSVFTFKPGIQDTVTMQIGDIKGKYGGMEVGGTYSFNRIAFDPNYFLFENPDHTYSLDLSGFFMGVHEYQHFLNTPNSAPSDTEFAAATFIVGDLIYSKDKIRPGPVLIPQVNKFYSSLIRNEESAYAAEFRTMDYLLANGKLTQEKYDIVHKVQTEAMEAEINAYKKEWGSIVLDLRAGRKVSITSSFIIGPKKQGN